MFPNAPPLNSRNLAAVLSLLLCLTACGDETTDPVVEPQPQGQPAPGEDGAACEAPEDCFGGTCLSELENGLPGGYCTSYDCTVDSCSGGLCVVDKWGNTACVDDCLIASDCRDGYVCVETGDAMLCDADTPDDDEVGVSPGGECVCGCEGADPLRISCGYAPTRTLEDDDGEPTGLFQWGLPYELTGGTEGVVLSVFPESVPSGSGPPTDVLSVRNELDDRLDLKGADSALNINSFLEQDLIAITIPHAPRYATFIDGYEGLLQVRSSADTLCVARAEGREGSAIDLELYLVGASGLQPDLLGVDPDFQAALAEMRRLLALAEIEIDDITPRVIDADLVEQYRIVRSVEEIEELLALTVDPTSRTDSSDDDAALVLNIVLVDDILLNDNGDLVGRAGSLPGPAGLHGTVYSGVVAGTSTLREDPEYMALILVHEAAHFMGLRHTSELFDEEYAFGRVDPLSDSPSCADVASTMEICPDYPNLMFPLAPPERSRDTVVITDDQGWVLRHNPLVR